MAKAKTSLLDEAVSTAVVSSGIQPWYRKVAPEHRVELEQAKADWKAGRVQRDGKRLALRVFANALSKVMQARGISNVGEQGVESWLRKD